MTSFTAVVSGEMSITALGPIREAAERMLGRLWIDEIPVRLASEDPRLWPSSTAAGAEVRALCWPGQPGPARAVLGRLRELREEALADGLTEVVLLGRGPTTRAAGLLARCRPDGDEPAADALTVLDGPEPAALLRASGDPDRLRRALVVVTGNDQATDTLRRAFVQQLLDAGLTEAEIARRFVVVTEPGGVPAKRAAEAGHALIEAPEATAFGALSPYAVVPAALAGADVATLLERAAAVLPSLTRPENNPGLVLGAILGGAARAGRATVVLGGYPASVPGLADWVAPLLADATRGRVLPIVQRGGMTLMPADDVFLVTLDGRPNQDDATASGPLPDQLVVWEYAAAVAAHLLGADPLDPAARLPETPLPDTGEAPAFADPGGVDVHTADARFAAAPDLDALVESVVARASEDGHLAIVAHLDPDEALGEGARVRRLAALLAARCARPVTITWGCRYPAIGNDHRERGVYLMLTGNAVHDVPVPGRFHHLGALQLAQALGETRAAERAGRPVVRLHLQDRWAGLARLLESARGEA
ncbi:glucose-6-phosphate isomerase [Spirillospora sp. CA-294931]|uniref:glucose-6-phosphate isomerase n=1 Tax=Spirillospora sp. CA-294931 TaxID=3240042 RepID=UPI003D8FD2E7